MALDFLLHMSSPLACRSSPPHWLYALWLYLKLFFGDVEDVVRPALANFPFFQKHIVLLFDILVAC